MKMNMVILMTAFVVSTSLEARADVVTENSYFQNKAQVVADAKEDCAAMIDQQIKVAPKSLIKAKGEQAVREHFMVTCAYSGGATLGSELYKKNKNMPKQIAKSLDDIEPLDSVQTMQRAAKRCGEKIIADWNKVGRPPVSQQEAQDGLTYCMTIEGARDGWNFSEKQSGQR